MRTTTVSVEDQEIGTNQMLHVTSGEEKKTVKKKSQTKENMTEIVEKTPETPPLLLCPMKMSLPRTYSFDPVSGRIVGDGSPYCDMTECAWWRGTHCSSSHVGTI